MPPNPFPDEGRLPEAVMPGLWLFAPNRDTGGGSAWLLELDAVDVLVDCPALTAANLAFLAERCRRRGGAAEAGWIVLTGREGHGRCRRLQEALGWPVLVQEQEAYLLPGLQRLQAFGEEHSPAAGVRLLWTPGTSPGACVLHVRPAGAAGMDGLFCGRLLVPVAPGRLEPLPASRCFHAPRRQRSLRRLRSWLPSGSPVWIASGAPLGGLRGGRLVEQGARLLAELVPDDPAFGSR